MSTAVTDTATETPRALTAREQIAVMLHNQHEERMARALRPAEPSYELARKSPAGKTSGWEFTITHTDPAEMEELADRWDKKYAAPQPVVKP